MKIDKINDTDYQIYIFKYNENLSIENIKVLLHKLKSRLGLNGFYRVVFSNKTIGTFIDIVRIEKSFYKDVLDLRIILEDEEEVYFKTKDYFLIKGMNYIKYLDEYYYVLVDDSFDRILEKVEFGEFIFGYDNISFLDKAKVI